MRQKILSLFTALTIIMSFLPTFTASATNETQYQAAENGKWLTGSLNEAAANVYDGGTIKILTDICLTETITVSKSLTITSAGNPYKITHTIADFKSKEADNLGIMFNANQGNFKLENIILDGGDQDSIYHPLVYISGAEMTIGNGAVIQNNYNRNTRSISGGAVCVREGKLVMEDGSKIVSCICKQGGAVEVNSNINLSEKADFTMNGGSIENCRALSGGAIYINAGTFHLKNGEIKNNVVTGATFQNGGGGAIFINGVQWSDHVSTATAYIEGGKIIGNTSNYYGGAIRVNHENAILAIRDGSITENSAKFGGGISGINGNILLYGGEITKNRAANYGSGVYCAPNLGTSACYITIAGNLIVKDNVSGDESNPVSDNVYLDGYEDNGDKSTPVRIIGKLGDDACLGMSRWVKPDDTANPSREAFVPSEAAESPYTIAENDLAKIHADDEQYAFILHEGKILMVLAVDIELDKSELTFTDKSTAEQLTATVTPDNAIIKDVTWKSDNEAVAIVDENGNVTPKHNGTCKITATTVSPYNTAADCIVTVTDRPHTLVKHDTIPAACTETGIEEYWKCEGDGSCGKIFADADAKTEISEPVTIESLGHKWGKWTLGEANNKTSVTRICEHDSSHTETLDADISLTPAAYTYNGLECKPTTEITVSDGEKKTVLEADKDYTVTYKNNINAGTATAIITGTGNYIGSVEKTYTIEKADVPPVTAGRLNIANNLKKEYTYLLSRLCPKIKEPGEPQDWGSRKYEILETNFTKDGYYDKDTIRLSTAESGGEVNNTVYLPIKFNDTTTTGAVGSVKVKISSLNYKDFTNIFEIYADNKEAVTFEGPIRKDGVYNGQRHDGYSGEIIAKDSKGNPVTVTPEIRYTGRLETGYSERAEAPTNAGTYSVIFRVADNDENYIGKRTVNFEITKADGSGSVTMADFEEGETPSIPIPLSQTNGTDNVTYKYKQFAAPDEEYSDKKPTKAGKYTLMALFGETQNYNSASTIAHFTIKAKPTPNASPTVTPSASPTVTPSASPNVTPSVPPTVTPSASPTIIPTTKPHRGGGSSSRTTPVPKPTNTPAPVSSAASSPDTSETSDKHFLYVVGYPDGKFQPDNGISRAEVSAILARLTDGFEENKKYASAFSDIISGAWYENYVGFEENKNIIDGYPDGEFKPDRFITRAEFAAMIARYTALDCTDGSDYLFRDIKHWAYAQIAACHKAGYIEGYEDNTFRPESHITRAEAVTIINRVLGRNDIKEFNNPFSDVSKNHWAYTDIMEAAITHNAEQN